MSQKELLTLATISTISIKTDSLDCTDNKLIAVTAAGTICGTYVSEPIKESLKNDTAYLFFENIGNIAAEKCNEPSSFFLLKDATLVSDKGIQNNFKFLYLFVEDIIALSFGDLSYN